MKISVVIATFNRRESLSLCLTTLNDQDLAADEYEVVVVIDGSSDDSAAMLESFPFRGKLSFIVQPENRGQTAALNAGARLATGEYILFLDDDLLCDSGLLSAHVASHMQADSPRLVSGRMRTSAAKVASFTAQSFHSDIERYYAGLELNPTLKFPDDAWAGPNCSLPRDIFLRCGGYDETSFPWRGEDIDLGLRLWKMGIEFHFAPQAITWHRWVKSDSQSWNDFERDGASIVTLGRKHLEFRRRNALTHIASGKIWKRYAKIAMASVPWLTNMPLATLVMIFDRSPTTSWQNRVGMWCFELRRNLAQLAGARREAGSWHLLMQLLVVRVSALMYHHIGFPSRDTAHASLTVSPRKFERHMRWLRWRGYTAITPAQWFAFHQAGGTFPKKSIILTFDDAYDDLMQYALPALKRQGFRAAVFVITQLSLMGGAWERKKVMTEEQIREWAAQGMEVGGHSRTHADLTTLSDAALREEVNGSYLDLAEAGLRPVSFAYPFGYFDKRVKAAIAEKFQVAFTCEEGLNDLDTDPLSLRRTMVLPNDNLLDLELRARYGRSQLHNIAARIRLRSRLRGAMRRIFHVAP